MEITPMKIFAGIIILGLIIIFGAAAFIFIFPNESVALQGACPRTQLTIAQWNDCISTKSYYATKAYDTKDISYCNTINEVGKRLLGNNVVVDGEYNARLRAQCKAGVSNDIRYCFGLEGVYQIPASGTSQFGTAHYHHVLMLMVHVQSVKLVVSPNRQALEKHKRQIKNLYE